MSGGGLLDPILLKAEGSDPCIGRAGIREGLVLPILLLAESWEVVLIAGDSLDQSDSTISHVPPHSDSDISSHSDSGSYSSSESYV